ncbi:MAG: cell division protein FtsH [candidate division Zixibacteria bacterium RBG_16_50_21]|nr:MAG: cell division protein FtsH [candidate division Zixibacteria bacterium RBG_16_50_21]
MQEQPTPRQKPRISWTWWLLFLVLMVWNLWSFLPRSQPEINLPYSSFLDFVKSGTVASIQISGSDITGQFLKPVTWPENPIPIPSDASAAQSTPAGGTDYSVFKTTFPEVEGDPNLLAFLSAHNVEVNVVPPPSPWFTILLTDGMPLLLMVVFLVWIGRSAAQSQAGIFRFGRSKPRQFAGDLPQVTFEDIAGADEAKGELKEVVDFLRHPGNYYKLGARIPRGVLLVGPPGTGKTLLARAVAGEAGVPFFSISASEFVEMFVGVGASRVRDLFEQAKATAPGIVFIDELDAVGRRRGAGLGAVNDEREQTLNQLLVEMDGFDEHHQLIILAATNRPDVLDPALLRPGRFDRQVTVGLPDRQGRQGILHIHTRQLQLDPDVNLGLLARTTTGFNGADLANLCNEAALIAAREKHEMVKMVDFEEALDRILLGTTRTILLNDHERLTVAYHEAGHAMVAWLTPFADPVHKVTIIPHGRALGVTEQMPSDDTYNYSRSYLAARLAVILGGRAAEEIALDDITTGAENDLVEATRLARRMITRWGMGSLGLMAFSADEEQPFLGYELSQGRDYSEETAARIDQDVQHILQERYQTVRNLLTETRQQLDRLVQVLLHDETIDQGTLLKILGPRILAPAPEISQPVEAAQVQ